MNLLHGAAFAVGIAIVAFLFYGAIGGPVSEMHNGRIVVTTTIPQICWTFGASGMAQGTGWDKFPDRDVWFRYVGEPHEEVGIESLRVAGYVGYPGETAADIKKRRDAFGRREDLNGKALVNGETKAL
mgnify:CR=1 FL=1